MLLGAALAERDRWCRCGRATSRGAANNAVQPAKVAPAAPAAAAAPPPVGTWVGMDDVSASRVMRSAPAGSSAAHRAPCKPVVFAAGTPAAGYAALCAAAAIALEAALLSEERPE